MENKIFLSVGRTFTQEQEEFVSTLEEFLQGQGVTPQTVGRTYFSSQQPLKAVMELMQDCCGSIILALERTQIVNAVEKRGSKDERSFADIKLPTVWNQIEAAMAYGQGHPLLVIMEDSIKEEGLLERGYDWYVKRVALSREALYDREFMGVFGDWKRRVEEFGKLKETASRPVSIQPASRQSNKLPLFLILYPHARSLNPRKISL
jgi:hypothetical protein